MAHRRISSTEKGKGLALDSQHPQRTARVKVPLPDNSDLLRKHSLTLIGRVTNKSVQKVWSLIPFFIEHWKTEFKPVGADLGNGLFQFQFERETDLLAVLDQRPYHYARWMIILQRWEPTLSPSFPSLIPFWIKVQGLPVHLWTEDIIKIIGQDIGQYEKAEITTLTARMKVHIDGLLPLIKSSVVEFPNGDEVTTTLVYERLDKHCTKCMRLDHELKECLVARAETRALKAAQEESLVKKNAQPGQEADSRREVSIASAHNVHTSRGRDHLNNVPFQFSASNQEMRLKLAAETKGDIKQLNWFCEACKGTPQPMNLPMFLQTTEKIISNELTPSVPLLRVAVEVEEGSVHYPSFPSTNFESKEGSGGSGVCVICVDASAEAACVPCGHVAGCISCLKEIKNKKLGCPICRASIDQVIKLYHV